MKSFDFKDVRLEKGMLKDVLDETLAFYLAIPNDNILKYMRERAGLPAPGIHYGGWFKNSGGLSLIGQWLSAYSRMYAITGNDAFREKALYLSDEFWNCYEKAMDRSPFFSEFSHYSIEKLLRAQCDLYLYCSDQRAEERAAYLVDYANRNLNADNVFGDNSTEWYTITEAFLDARELFGLEEAGKVAERFEYREYWDLFYRDEDPFSRHPQAGFYSEFCHAYSHTNSFNSCARSYEATHDPYYLKALRTFYDFMQKEEVMATGGFGPNFEHIMPKNRIIDALRTGHDSFETQCDSYAAYRVSKYLTRLTGEARYGGWTESLLYNATAATLPMTEEGGVVYYSDYNMYGAAKFNRQDSWTCCTGTRPLLVAEMQRLIYFEDQDGLYVSQFVPSSLRWDRDGQTIQVSQSTGFPETEDTGLTFALTEDVSFALHFRMPAWLAGPMDIAVNGIPAETTVDERGWLKLERVWKDGDSVKVRLPRKVWMHSLDPVKDGPNAFLCGPVVLAASYTGIQTPNDWMDVQALVQKMRPVEGKPMHYTVEGNDTITFKPFYEYAEGERYFLYHDTTAHATKIHRKKKASL